MEIISSIAALHKDFVMLLGVNMQRFNRKNIDVKTGTSAADILSKYV